jgi:RNA polymerase sigma-70 factor (ECF subfamily)
LTRDQFKYLFDKHFDSVRKYIYYRSGDAEMATDIAQETFMKIWEKQPAADQDNLAGLLYKIAGDQFISQYRRQQVMSKFRLNSRPETSAGSPEEQLVFEELKSRYESALAILPENQRTVFLLSRMDQLKYYEIAERLGLSVKAVEKRMTLALASLRLAIGNK